MVESEHPWAAAAARFVYRRWCLTLTLVTFSALLHVVFLRDKYDHLPNFSLAKMAATNASGESPDNPGAGCTSCYLGQERCWADICKELQKARQEANEYFDSQVLMKVQHRLPLDNGTLYGELQSLKADTLYRFRSQIGVKDVTGHFWDNLEVDMGKTILSLLELNQMVAKENNEEGGHCATLKAERDCNMTVSQIKVICLESLIMKNTRESRQRERASQERARRATSSAQRMRHQWIKTENKLKEEREAFKRANELREKFVHELEHKKHEEEMKRVLDRERARRRDAWARRTCGLLQLKTKELKQELEQERKAHRPQMMMKFKHSVLNAFTWVILAVTLCPVTIFILYVIWVKLTSRTSHEQSDHGLRRSFSFQFATTGLLLTHDQGLTTNTCGSDNVKW
ncbi:uncharacterized protein LOC144878398 [Branchiostoma floridae x Branchiostoma japonicum]